MFTDNRITLEFIKSNKNIIIIEDNTPQVIELSEDKGFIQKTFDNITVSFVRYIGILNSKNFIKYNYNYFSKVFNSSLKDYEKHLNDLLKDEKIILQQSENDNKTETGTENIVYYQDYSQAPQI